MEEPQQELSREQLQAMLAQQEQAAMGQCIQQLRELAAGMGFEIIAIPQLTSDGRLVAQWGIRRAQG